MCECFKCAISWNPIKFINRTERARQKLNPKLNWRLLSANSYHRFTCIYIAGGFISLRAQWEISFQVSCGANLKRLQIGLLLFLFLLRWLVWHNHRRANSQHSRWLRDSWWIVGSLTLCAGGLLSRRWTVLWSENSKNQEHSLSAWNIAPRDSICKVILLDRDDAINVHAHGNQIEHHQFNTYTRRSEHNRKEMPRCTYEHESHF